MFVTPSSVASSTSDLQLLKTSVRKESVRKERAIRKGGAESDFCEKKEIY